MHSREDISRSPSPRGRAPHISLTAPQNTPEQSPDPHQSASHARSSSEGTARGRRSRPTGRVKFIGDEETPQQSDGQRPPDTLNIEENLPRTPPIAHCNPRVESESDVSDDLVGYFDQQPSSGASTPMDSTEHISSRVNLLNEDENAGHEDAGEKRRAMHGAYDRAQRLSSLLRRSSAQSKEPSGLFHRFSRRHRNKAGPSPERSKQSSWDDLDIMEKQAYYSDDDDYVDDAHINADLRIHGDELMRSMSRLDSYPLTRVTARSHNLPSGQVTPIEERDPHDYVARPSQYRPGVLGALLKMYSSRVQEESQSQQDDSPPSLQAPNRAASVRSSSRSPKQKWYNNKGGNQSMPFLGSLSPLGGSRRPSTADKRSTSGKIYTLAKQKFSSKRRLEEEIRLTVHIRETRQRKKYLDRLCRALMNCGAPSHRLEEYMRMTARVLELEGSFTYFPGTMLMAFEDSTTDTTDLKMVRAQEGVNLGRLRDIQTVYKEVVHDIIGVEEAMQRLREIMNAKPKYGVLWLILLHGLACAMVGPFAFGARPIDMPICFILGCILAVLQHVLAPRSSHYANVFEISAAVIITFLARAFGSIKSSNGQYVFCFAALAQSSICLILPGYIVLCGALALQSRNIIAGSVRMVYAIIYSLFLGFGMLIGTALYGAIDKNATSEFACPASPIRNEYLQRFPFVLGFAICSSLINQAKFKQIPVMVTIAVTGYIVRFFAARQFEATQISSALGALAIGIMGNLYSRLGHGLAAAAILPAIFLQLPSGLASSGSLVTSLIVATNIKSNFAAKPLGDLANELLGNTPSASSEEVRELVERLMMNRFSGNVVFDVGYGMLEVAIGISGGLFMAALVVYPFGKRRSGLFSF